MGARIEGLGTEAFGEIQRLNPGKGSEDEVPQKPAHFCLHCARL